MFPQQEYEAMTNIKKYVEQIGEELHDSKCYMEKALEYKSMGLNDPRNADRYNGYKTMSVQELEHSSRLHQYAAEDIEQLKSVYPEIPPSMMEKWEKAHSEYVEKAAWIKQMQSM